MQDELLASLISNFLGKGDSDTGEGDYQDLLWQFMHAKNQGLPEEDLDWLAHAVPDNRADEMADYGGGPHFERDPHIMDARRNLNRRLRS